MLERKREYIAEALDEIRDEYIDEAVTCGVAAGDGVELHDVSEQDSDANAMDAGIVSMDEVVKKKKHRRFNTVFGSLVACLVVAIALGTYHQFGGGYGSADPAGSQAPSGSGGMAQIKESAGAPAGDAATESVLAGLDIDKELVITSEAKPASLESVALKGSIEKIDIVYATECTYILVSVEATEAIAGEIQVGEVYEIWIPADVDNDSTAKSYLAMLERGLEDGKEYIFTPYVSETDGRLIAYRKD